MENVMVFDLPDDNGTVALQGRVPAVANIIERFDDELERFKFWHVYEESGIGCGGYMAFKPLTRHTVVLSCQECGFRLSLPVMHTVHDLFLWTQLHAGNPRSSLGRMPTNREYFDYINERRRLEAALIS